MISKEILSFRPFRRVKDKIVVTSYMGWNRLQTANYNESVKVKLLTIPNVKIGELIYTFGKINHWNQIRFEPLFWPVNAQIRHITHDEAMAILGSGLPHPYSYPIQENEVFSCFDCSGTPCFSHITPVYVAENYPEKMHLFEPLTASIVYQYFEEMRDRLKNITWIK